MGKRKRVGKETNIKKPIVTRVEASLNEYAMIERIEATLRLYFKKIGNSISIYYRPTHSYIKSCLWDDEGKKEIVDLVRMPIYNFYDMLYEIEIRVPDINSKMSITKDIVLSDRESWFIGAWMSQTITLLNSLGLDIETLYEQIPFSYVYDRR